MRYIRRYKTKANACIELANYLLKQGHYAKAYPPKESKKNGWGYYWTCYSDAGGDDWTCGITDFSPYSPLVINLYNKNWFTYPYDYSKLRFANIGEL